VFHIHDESPEHHKASFWVSRLNSDGTDADIGAIPNSPRAKYYIEEQGEGVCYSYVLKLPGDFVKNLI